MPWAVPTRQRELAGLNGGVPAPLAPWRAKAQFTVAPPSSTPPHHSGPCLGPGDPRADAHCPESPEPASYPPSSLPHLCPQAGPVDSIWAGFSVVPGMVCVASRQVRSCASWGHIPPPLLVVQSVPLSTPLTLALHLGKGGCSVREGKEGGQGRGSFLKERKPGSLGTEKASPPPPYSWFPVPSSSFSQHLAWA